MGWLRLVGSIKLYVSGAKEPCRRDNILQKRPIMLSILLTEDTPCLSRDTVLLPPPTVCVCMCVHVCVCVCLCVCVCVGKKNRGQKVPLHVRETLPLILLLPPPANATTVRGWGEMRGVVAAVYPDKVAKEFYELSSSSRGGADSLESKGGGSPSQTQNRGSGDSDDSEVSGSSSHTQSRGSGSPLQTQCRGSRNPSQTQGKGNGSSSKTQSRNHGDGGDSEGGGSSAHSQGEDGGSFEHTVVSADMPCGRQHITHAHTQFMSIVVTIRGVDLF